MATSSTSSSRKRGRDDYLNARVKIDGLERRKDLNGAVGTVVTECKQGTDGNERWVVRLKEEPAWSGMESISVRAQNLTIIASWVRVSERPGF